jgi:rhodanese-related sulfurtransferase
MKQKVADLVAEAKTRIELQETGDERGAHLDGGFKAWKEAGKPTE